MSQKPTAPLIGCVSIEQYATGLKQQIESLLQAVGTDATSGQCIQGERYALFLSRPYGRIRSHNSQEFVVQAGIGTDDVPDVECSLHGNNFTLSRDIFGRMPLYYLRKRGIIWFSTHLSVLRLLLDTVAIDPESFYAYASFSFIPAPLTPFAEVFAVPAGCVDQVELVSMETNSTPAKRNMVFGRAPADQSLPPPLSEEVAVEQLQKQLQAAMDCSLSGMNGDRVAVFLSGGLDSAITAAMLKHRGLQVTAYSLDFGVSAISELPVAQEVGAHLGIPVKIVKAHPGDIKAAFPEAIRDLDTAFGDGVTTPLWLLNRAAARDGHTVAFNGEGGDQLFAGWTNKPLIASTIYGDTAQAVCDRYESYMRTFHRLYGHESLMFSRPLLNRIELGRLHHHVCDALETTDESFIHCLRRANLHLKGAQNIQPRASNLAIAHGLQLNSLFCHKPLADWTFDVSPELMLKGSCEKYILKRAVENLLPQSVVYREKRGMGVPLTQFCLGPLWSYLGKYLNEKRLSATGYWQLDAARRLALGDVSARLTGRRIGETLWLMLAWEAWLAQSGASFADETRYNLCWPPVTLLRLLHNCRKDFVGAR